MSIQLALSYTATGELFSLVKRELELCMVQAKENVLLHCTSETYPHYPAAFMGAALELGADVFQITHPHTEERAIVDAWKRADLVVDLSAGVHAYGDIIRDAQKAGTRILRVVDSPENLRRLFPIEQMRKRVEAGAKIMGECKTMHITSPSGTDLTLYKGGRIGQMNYSVSDKPGRWDIWPSGMVNCAPIEDMGEGTLVLAPGDVMLPPGMYVRERVTMEIKDGCITSIYGGFEADLLKEEWFAKFDDPNAYRISHVGWGCEKRASWLKIGQDNECFYGNMQIAFGANVGVFIQGRTRSRAHIDFPCRFNSFWCDDIQIMDRGKFLIDELV